MRIHFAFIGRQHRNISRQTTENLTIGGPLKHCQASGYSGSVRSMKRWMWSLLFGLLIPVSYFFGLLLLESHIDWSYRKSLQIPVAWPRIIYFYFSPPDPFSPTFHDTFDSTLFLFIVLCNLAAYSLIGYGVLSGVAAVRRRSARPSPPLTEAEGNDVCTI